MTAPLKQDVAAYLAPHCPKHPIRADACKACDRLTALAELRALCPPGTTVYTILRSVSRSGMSRWLSVFLIRDGEPYAITGDVARALGERLGDSLNGHRALQLHGGGMDMGFHLVHSLSYALHGMENTYVPGKPSTTYRPGYTLNHRWL